MNRRWTIILSAAAGIIVVLAGVLYWLTRPLPVLTVATWSGPYGRAQANALFRTFGDARRIDVHIALYDGGLRELHRTLASGQYEWDVMDFELPDAIEACRRGWLEPIDADSLPAGADGTPAAKDFVRNAL